MAVESFANNASTALNGNITNSQTTITVLSANGFPTTGQYRIIIDSELMLVTGGQGTTTWTVTRNIEGSAAATHANGAPVTHIITAGGLSNMGPSGTFSAVAANFNTGGITIGRFLGIVNSASPTGGPYNQSDFVIDFAGRFWVCETGGSPGVWLPIGPGTYVASMFLNTSQTIASGTTGVQVGFDTKNFDANNNLTVGASAHYSAPVTGYYRVSSGVRFNSTAATEYTLRGMVNAVEVVRLDDKQLTPAGVMTLSGSAIFSLTAGDSLSMSVSQASGVSQTLQGVSGGTIFSYMDVHFVAQHP